jgi:hypothetical protein
LKKYLLNAHLWLLGVTLLGVALLGVALLGVALLRIALLGISVLRLLCILLLAACWGLLRNSSRHAWVAVLRLGATVACRRSGAEATGRALGLTVSLSGKA